jgi:hypothetical protein
MALFEGLRQLFGRNEELTDEQKKRRGRLNRVARGAGVVASPITAVSLIPKEKKDKALEFGKSVVQGTARNLALVASGLFAPLPEGQKPTLNPKKRFQQFSESPITVKNQAASMLFGKPQGETFSLKSEGGEFLAGIGAGENTQKNLAAPLGVFLGTLDASGIPAGKIVKEAKVLAKLTDELDIIPKIKKMFPGAKDLDIEEIARRVANISDEKEIETILKNPQKVLEEVPAVVDDVASKTLKAVPETTPRILDEADPTAIRESVEEGAKAADDVPVQNMDDIDKIIKEKSPINLSKYDLSDAEKARFAQFLNDVGKVPESSKGAPIKWDEVAEAAKGAQAFEKGMTRTEMVDLGASIYKTRQKLNSVLKADGTIDEEVFKEAATKIIPTLEEFAADAGRQLNFLKMKVGDEGTNALLEKLLKMKDKTDDILKAAKGVNLNDPAEALKLYRQFEKARFWDVLTEYRYANMLSSPRTHIINAFSNVIQGSILRPLTKLTTGVFDSIGSALTGKAREAYVREVPAYYKGAFNAVPDAARNFMEVMRGKIPIEQLDLKRLPSNSKFMKYTGLRYVSRLMEANDVLFRTMIQQGEREALAFRTVKKGGLVNARTMAAIDKQANETALEYVFRKPLDTMNETGQGSVLSGIDKATALILKARDLPGIGWFVPFIQTPMNILKQGIEFSPLGALTLINNTRKTEQLAKMAIGSAVFVGAGALALEGKTTWGAPENAKDREAFYASGRRPYSVKIGDKWVSYSKLGPLAYPMALASAVQYYWNENPDSYDDETHNKALLVLQGVAEFLSDQSYMQGLSEIMGSLTGAPGSKGVVPTTIDTFTGQLIPLSSLQRWVNNFIDPIYRKQENDVSVEAIINNLKPNIIGLKSQMDAYTNPDGTASVRDYPGLNAFSPVEISSSKPEGEELYTEGLKMRKIANQRKISDDEVQAVVDELNSLPLSKAILEFTKLKKENPALAQRVDNQKKKEKLALTPLQQRMASLNVTDGTRAEYIYSYVHSLPLAERAKVIAELRAKKIITEAVEKQLKVIASTQ